MIQTPDQEKILIGISLIGAVFLATVFLFNNWKEKRKNRKGLYYPKEKLKNLN
jgi:hypothetical protein